MFPKAGKETQRHAKFHLVDLAGSERISKTSTNPNDLIFKEACGINLALHFLQQVILALQQQSAGKQMYVPYRNSMMTMVLKDSLGGNCKTIMISTVAVEESNIDETISTCRFAQVVSTIKNTAHVNEQTDPVLYVRLLKAKVLDLKEEVRILKGSNQEVWDALSDDAVSDVKCLLKTFLSDHEVRSKYDVLPMYILRVTLTEIK